MSIISRRKLAVISSRSRGGSRARRIEDILQSLPLTACACEQVRLVDVDTSAS
jgi:hypothetical protein